MDRVRVLCRVRPETADESRRGVGVVKIAGGMRVDLAGASEFIGEHEGHYTFDAALGVEASQAAVYDAVAKPMVADVLRGFNATLFAYGQTGAGKTHSMFGPRDAGDGSAAVGVVPRLLVDIFRSLSEGDAVSLSCLELYDDLRDLLAPGGAPARPLKIVETKDGTIDVDGCRLRGAEDFEAAWAERAEALAAREAADRVAHAAKLEAAKAEDAAAALRFELGRATERLLAYEAEEEERHAAAELADFERSLACSDASPEVTARPSRPGARGPAAAAAARARSRPGTPRTPGARVAERRDAEAAAAEREAAAAARGESASSLSASLAARDAAHGAALAELRGDHEATVGALEETAAEPRRLLRSADESEAELRKAQANALAAGIARDAELEAATADRAEPRAVRRGRRAPRPRAAAGRSASSGLPPRVRGRRAARGGRGRRRRRGRARGRAPRARGRASTRAEAAAPLRGRRPRDAALREAHAAELAAREAALQEGHALAAAVMRASHADAEAQRVARAAAEASDSRGVVAALERRTAELEGDHAAALAARERALAAARDADPRRAAPRQRLRGRRRGRRARATPTPTP
ncbi:hypothetical protein JL720_5240 [Aureococcus anophagefferens]|nr:hypothetical protein JL720_5240 [Aureococcus anophagefferens]